MEILTMAYDPTLHVNKISAHEATCLCPCGQHFVVDAIEERQMVFDSDRRLLRAVCPRCGRMEDPDPFWKAARDSARDPGPNRIAEYLD
jgi:hypothetical protein